MVSEAFLQNIKGAGLGLRRGLLKPLREVGVGAPDFMELTPDNWIGVGGALGRQLRFYTERYSFIAHGLSLSLGGPDPLDFNYLAQLKQFLSEHNILAFSEHLSYCSADGHLYDLMPLPFTDEAVLHTASRIRHVQDVLEQRIAIENISYYAAPFQQLSEIEFLNAVLSEADCDLLLDVNNVYVNSVNYSYDPCSFIAGLPPARVRWIHVAGHHADSPDLLIDTHGTPVSDPVWQLLALTYQACGLIPTVLERDFNYPPMDALLSELQRIRTLQGGLQRETNFVEACSAI